MITYDQWKTDFPEEPENECYYCKAPCDGTYCSDECKKADIL